jgi:hypothetical protein
MRFKPCGLQSCRWSGSTNKSSKFGRGCCRRGKMSKKPCGLQTCRWSGSTNESSRMRGYCHAARARACCVFGVWVGV